MQSPRILLGLPCLGLLVMISPPPSQGCAVCMSLNNPLALPHPKAIEIAIATRAAVDKGLLLGEQLIPAATVLPNGTGFIALKRVPAGQLVKSWMAGLKPGGQRSDPLIVHFLFVDTEEACGVEFRSGVAQYQSKLSTHSDTRLVTTKIAFHAILTGKLTAAQAKELGLMCVEGSAQNAGCHQCLQSQTYRTR
jgi:hypothetical protein